MFQTVIEGVSVKANQMGIVWLGQAGFLLKTPLGKVILIDPYLTDYVYNAFKAEHGYGFKRMSAPVFVPGEVVADALFSSHEHGDHLDVDAIGPLMNNGKTVLYANRESADIAAGAGVPEERIRCISKDEALDFGEFKLTVTTADHGELCKDAMGFLFDFGFVRIYYSGDTAYNPRVLQKAIQIQPEIALLPINGAFGNLNAEQAAKLANDMNSKVCIPHHFWTFPLHRGEKGDPIDAIELFPSLAPKCELRLLTPGEPYIYGA